ncbi:acyl-CoA thioesterase [Tomitella fengzijianii]|uniref:Acyl-CoA thioesterase n=1 Tax=Tomitella fengzijianii TaxID=2597660 RepID=A0A516X0R4_9ACTN|nr:thioesterase family protein [Tomitella fengzijianii]QDQ96201.1 acyl-CoA thioesterase [Tomitella fengzijianii]
MTAATAAPAVTIRRRLEWPDTDAAGHQHHSVVMRWAEEAEAELLESIGYATLFGRIPRVVFEAQYLQRLWLRDPVEIRFGIDAVGRTSLTYTFEVEGPQGVAATGRMVVVHTDGNAGGAVPWPDGLRPLLTGEARPPR